MKLVSWNVNGLRACWGKGFEEAFSRLDADVFCLQETKMQPGQLEVALPGRTETDNQNGTVTVSPAGTRQDLLPIPAGVTAI